MPPTANKTLSPAELAKLEHAFATDPSSEAYRPLAEAYLGMGRFMEAMVVCKKGVKAHPNRADPRVLLARVYAEQGKDKKALEELTGALQVAPADKAALRLTGSLQLKTGEAETGKANLLKAFELDPADQDTLNAMQTYKVDAPQKAAPLPPPQPTNGHAAPPVLQASQPRMQPVANSAPQLQPVHGGQPGQAQPPMPQQHSPALENSVQRRATQQAQVDKLRKKYEQEESISSVSELSEVPRRKARPSATHGFRNLVITGGILIAILAGYRGYGWYHGKIVQAVNKSLREAINDIKQDSFSGYEKCTKEAEKAVDADPSSLEAHSYAAYCYVIRWGEHGVDEKARAEEHLEYVKNHKGKNGAQGYAVAAAALYGLYSGKGAEALKELNGEVEELESKGQHSATLFLTQGILQMQQGDLEKAKEAMEKAQQLASDDPRVYVEEGILARRRGNQEDALRLFNSALKYTHNSHPEALLGTALLVLDQDNAGAGFGTAAKYIKSLLESEPPPSPRQLATAHMVKAFLISRASRDIPLYDSKDLQAKLWQESGVDKDPAKAKQDVAKEEQQGMTDSTNAELYLIKGKRLLYEDQFDAAAQSINEAIKMKPDRAYYYYELAKALMKKNTPEGDKQAEDALRKALGILPNSPKLMTQLGQVLYKQKKVDEALKSYSDVVRGGGKNPEAHFALGKILCDDKKDYKGGTENYEKAATEFVGDSSMVSASYDLEGLCYVEMKDNGKARDALEKAMNADHESDKALCDFTKFIAKLADAKDKEKIKTLADGYLKLAPKGECANDMKALGGAPPAP
ncbi:MAG: tetratricopeptide repeat protein [Myxococcaceae bacterium]